VGAELLDKAKLGFGLGGEGGKFGEVVLAAGKDDDGVGVAGVGEHSHAVCGGGVEVDTVVVGVVRVRNF